MSPETANLLRMMPTADLQRLLEHYVWSPALPILEAQDLAAGVSRELRIRREREADPPKFLSAYPDSFAA